MENKFFGSKLNSILLLILIILMIIALIIMKNNKDIYLLDLSNSQNQQINTDKNFEILGNKEDLVSFSITPGQEVFGKIIVNGSIKGGYFFEGNILVNILDANKTILKQGHGQAKTDWMTTSPVEFNATIDFTGLLKGPSFIEIQNDDPSGGEGGIAKKILIPIIIK